MPSFYYNRIVVIGARGFIGRILAEFLKDKAALLLLDLPELDMTSSASLAAALPEVRSFAEAGPTAIINAAGLMDASLSRREPDRFYRVNGTAVGAMKRWAAAAGVEGILHLSSETVFGSGPEPFADDGPRTPIHPYGISKLVAELVLAEDAGSPPPVVALRLPVVVGFGQAIGNPISMFCDEASRTGAITLFNGGAHRRKFVHVDDVVAQIAAVLSEPMEPGFTAYNVGGFIASMHEIATAVAGEIGNVEIRDQESKSQAFTLLSSSDRIEAKYGFRPRLDLAAMIQTFARPEAKLESTAPEKTV